MIVVRVLLTIKPECAAALVSYMAEESRSVREMDGCLIYELYQASSGEDYLLYEEWTDLASFDAYRASTLLSKSREVLGPMLEKPPKSAYYQATLFS